MLFNGLISALVQLSLFLIIPVVWWLTAARKQQRFLEWIGLRWPDGEDRTKGVLLSIAAWALLFAPGILIIVSFDDKTVLAGAQFANSGAEGLAALLVWALIQTGLTEELLFQGFINKRLSAKFGLTVGCSVAGVLFGGLHLAMVSTAVPLWLAVLVGVFAGTAAWLFGYINERLCRGSIIPSWLLHSAANFVTGLLFWTGVIAV